MLFKNTEKTEETLQRNEAFQMALEVQKVNEELQTLNSTTVDRSQMYKRVMTT